MSIVRRLSDRFDRDWDHPSWWMLLIVLPWTLAAAWAVYGWAADRTVAQREQIASGTIIAHEPRNHNRYGYRFSVDGKSYQGWASPHKNELDIGTQVTVFYDPSDPARNALTGFAHLAIESLGPVPLLLAGAGSVALFIRRRRAFHREAKSTTPRKC